MGKQKHNVQKPSLGVFHILQNTPDGKGVEWAGAREVSFASHFPLITICQVTDSGIDIGNYKTTQIPQDQGHPTRI